MACAPADSDLAVDLSADALAMAIAIAMVGALGIAWTVQLLRGQSYPGVAVCELGRDIKPQEPKPVAMITVEVPLPKGLAAGALFAVLSADGQPVQVRVPKKSTKLLSMEVRAEPAAVDAHVEMAEP